MKILNRWSDSIIFENEKETIKETVIDANLSGADLSGADLSGADLSGAKIDLIKFGDLDIPVIKKLNTQILYAIEHGGTLNMGSWHQCETTHCRAGWAVTLAGKEGHALENEIGTNAAALIFIASCPFLKKVPNFFADNETAMESIKADAAKEIEQCQY